MYINLECCIYNQYSKDCFLLACKFNNLGFIIKYKNYFSRDVINYMDYNNMMNGLMWACQNSNNQMVKYLLDNFAHLMIFDNYNYNIHAQILFLYIHRNMLILKHLFSNIDYNLEHIRFLYDLLFQILLFVTKI